MKPLVFALGLLLAVPLLAGDDPIARFRKKHPDEASHFTILFLTSFDAEIKGAQKILAHELIATKRAAALLGEKDDSTKVRSLIDSIKESRMKEQSVWEERKSRSREGDFLCYFEWKKGLHWRTGYIVLNDGDDQGEWVTEEGFGPEEEQKPEPNPSPMPAPATVALPAGR